MSNPVATFGPGSELLVEARGPIRITATDAVQIGIANRVVPTGAALDTAIGLAERLAALPPQAVRETKALLNDAVHRVVETMLAKGIAAESASFDEAAFRLNLTRMLERSGR